MEYFATKYARRIVFKFVMAEQVGQKGKVMKIIHIADVHIGMEFGANRARSRSRKQEILNGFLDVVSFAADHQVDAMLVAGDLFDSDDVDGDMVARIADSFAQAKEVDIYIAPGNHDPLTASSTYNRQWSDNVHIFNSQGEVIKHEDKGYRIWGRGFDGAFCNEPLLKGITIPQDGLVNLGILHGELIGTGAGSTGSAYNPISDDDIMRSGMDYLALGHIHLRTEPAKLGRTTYAYCGTPEGQGFDETGIKGFYYGEIKKDSVDLELVTLSKRRYYKPVVNITGCANEAEVVNRTLRTLTEQAIAECDEHYENNLYKITFSGEISGERPMDFTRVHSDLEDMVYFVKVKDRTRLSIDYEKLSMENSLKGMFVRRMLNQINEVAASGNEQLAETYRGALDIGIRAFAGEVKDED